MKAGLTVEKVYATIHPHPTLSEIIRDAAADALRKKS
jgi:pyruvate/2-oxoglutarate dehydrogenase complex dihydrolipoamide dehydrogenase (E3) component